MPTATRRSSREKVRAYRTRMKRKGLRLVQMWVPDTRSAAFRRQARRDCVAVAKSAHAAADQEFVDAISAWDAGK
jgi:hypothetical protein